MTTLPTDYSHQQLVDALQAEYIQLMHDVEPTDDDFTLDEHLDYLNAMTHAELIVETSTDDENPLSEFMYAYSWCLPPAFTVGCRLHVYHYSPLVRANAHYFTYTCLPINHLHSSATSAQMYFVARVTYNSKMVSSTRITMYHVVHCLTLSSTSLCLLVSGSTVTVWTATQQVHLCLTLTKFTLLSDSTLPTNYSFTQLSSCFSSLTPSSLPLFVTSFWAHLLIKWWYNSRTTLKHISMRMLIKMQSLMYSLERLHHSVSLSMHTARAI